jgi:DNA modification methylase
MVKQTAQRAGKTIAGHDKGRLKVEYLPLDQLKPWSANPQIHSPEQVAEIGRSIAGFGMVEPILVRRADMEVIAGHGRLDSLKAAGATEVPVILLDLPKKRAHALALALNKIAEKSPWDKDKLPLIFAELKDLGADVELTGFSAEEITAYANKRDDAADVTEDAVPLPPKTPITKPGDLWLLGRHRLLCGDATNAEHVTRLTAGARAGLMNTDPPYGVGYTNEERPHPGVAKPRVAKPRVANDKLEGEKLQAFLEAAFGPAANIALAPNAAWYLWHAHLTQGFFAAAAAAVAAAVILHRQIIWVKPVLLLGRGQYHWKHEPCFMGWVRGHEPPDYGRGNGERDQTTVWEIASVTQAERKKFDHSTPKPVGLFAIPIIKHLRREEICYDPFAGSGPQVIAAEQLERRCYGMEIDPRYCDVIVERWQQFSGGKARREKT